MGFGIHNTSMPRTPAINANLKGDAGVRQFTEAAGLNVQNFPEYLCSLVAKGHDLAKLTNADWNEILGPMELGPERAGRVQKTISDLRFRAAKEDAELDEKHLITHLANGGAHPRARPNDEVHEPALNGARPKATGAAGSFIPVAYFQGERPGYVFKHGDEGLGYYAASSRGASPGPGTPAPTPLARGYNPISQAGLEEKLSAQQRAYSTSSKQQQLLIERRQRMDERASAHGYSRGEMASMYADARTRSSPFATGY